MGSAADDGVPHEEVRAGDSVEQLEGVRHGARDRDGRGEEQFPKGAGVGEEASDDHKGVHLPQGADGAAAPPYRRLVPLVA